MMRTRNRFGFTLIELLVVILILAILMAIALPMYLRAVRDSNRQTCRSNMQTIANALQAYKVRCTNHLYPGQTTPADTPIQLDYPGDGTPANPAFIGGTVTDPTDLQVLPRCPTDGGTVGGTPYTAEINADGQLFIKCASDNTVERDYHNTVPSDPGNTDHGFIVGVDNQ